MTSQRRMYLQPDAHALVEGFRTTLSYDDFDDYQKWMVNLLATHSAVYLGAFMGSGKTAVALKAFYDKWKAGIWKQALVIAPKNVAKDTWPDEIMVWDFAREFHYTVLVGTEPERLRAADEEADIFIVNRENLKWLHQTYGRKWFRRFDVLIYDEASRLKKGDKKTAKARPRKDGSVKGKTTSEFGYVNITRRKIANCWELSGTPSSNGLIDLWGPNYILDHGARLGSSLTAYRERWFSYDSYRKTWKPFDHSEAEIMHRLRDQMFVLREEDYIDLPPLVIRDRYVHLNRKHLAAYRRFEQTLFLDEYDVEAVNNGVLANKLLQFANGSIYSDIDQDDPRWRPNIPPEAKHIHDRKLDELESIIEEAAGHPVLIAYSFKFDVYAIKKRFPWIRYYGETPNDARDWNDGKLRAMILHPASAGHGLNFQHGGHIAVWYGLNWSLELYQQFNKRLHRRGQEASHVFLYRILAYDTYDERTANVLEAKGVTQDRITEYVRVHREQIARDLAA